MAGPQRPKGPGGRAIAVVLGIAVLGAAAACEPAGTARRTGPPAGFQTPPSDTFAPWTVGQGDEEPTEEPTWEPTDAPTETPTPAPKPVALPKITIRITGAKIDYFAVAGATSEKLLTSVQVHAAKDCGTIDYTWYSGDARPIACAEWAYWYRETYNSTSCRVSGVWLVQTVYFPQWTSPSRVSAPLLAWWRTWVAVVQKHEAGHVAIARKWLPSVRSRMLGIACSRVKTVMKSVSRQVEAAQEAYDRVQYDIQVFPDPPDQ